jgi:DNA repair protein RadC
VVSVGTLTASLVHPREVFRFAVREGAAAILLAHNHPSGDPTPSAEDAAVTDRLAATGRLVGIRVIDHVIVAAEGYYSFREAGRLDDPAPVAPGSA